MFCFGTPPPPPIPLRLPSCLLTAQVQRDAAKAAGVFGAQATQSLVDQQATKARKELTTANYVAVPPEEEAAAQVLPHQVKNQGVATCRESGEVLQMAEKVHRIVRQARQETTRHQQAAPGHTAATVSMSGQRKGVGWASRSIAPPAAAVATLKARYSLWLCAPINTRDINMNIVMY